MAYNRYSEEKEKPNILRKTGSRFFNIEQNCNNRGNNNGIIRDSPIKNYSDLNNLLNPNTKEKIDEYIKNYMNNLNGNNFFRSHDINLLNPNTSEVVNMYINNMQIQNNKNNRHYKNGQNYQHNQNYRGKQNNQRYQNYQINNYMNDKLNGGIISSNEDAQCRNILLSYFRERSKSPNY